MVPGKEKLPRSLFVSRTESGGVGPGMEPLGARGRGQRLLDTVDEGKKKPAARVAVWDKLMRTGGGRGEHCREERP